jgi:hypothetical protein
MDYQGDNQLTRDKKITTLKNLHPWTNLYKMQAT